MTESGLPLAGLRVLDISSFIAAPAAAVVLGDWGADVIKVEGPDGDPTAGSCTIRRTTRRARSTIPGTWIRATSARSCSTSRSPTARAALDRLIAMSDVLICNFPPPVRDKLRLAYEDVKRVNPKLIYASLTGYGETGPDRDRPGFDVTAYFARSGLLDAQRYEGGPPGVPVPAQGDRATAMTLVSAILMATDPSHEDRRGLMGRHLAARQRPVVVRRRRPGSPGRRLPAASAAAGPAALGAGQHLPHLGRSLAAAHHRARGQDVAGHLRDHRPPRAVGRSALRHGRGTAQALRRTRRHPERGLRQPRLRALAQDDVRARHHLRRHQPAAGRARRRSRRWPAAPSSTPRSPRCRARSANPIRLGFAEQQIAHAAPALGQHSDQILAEAGLSPDEIASLRASGAVP